jgi:hypothetical protein
MELMQVRVDEQSRAVTLREDTRVRAYQSLSFFLTSVLRVPVPVQVAEAIQALGLRRMNMLVSGTLLWLRLHKVKPLDSASQEAVRWIFPEAKDL